MIKFDKYKDMRREHIFFNLFFEMKANEYEFIAVESEAPQVCGVETDRDHNE